jgi:N-acetyltransferase 10
MSLFISSHYKNSPNDLQLLSDSPSHMIFVLCGPLRKSSEGKTEMPDVLCVVQLALEGNLSKAYINDNTQRGLKPSGDLIPWNIR